MLSDAGSMVAYLLHTWYPMKYKVHTELGVIVLQAGLPSAAAVPFPGQGSAG